jgi:uncharacterized repeat protein (TIGR04052 family)
MQRHMLLDATLCCTALLLTPACGEDDDAATPVAGANAGRSGSAGLAGRAAAGGGGGQKAGSSGASIAGSKGGELAPGRRSVHIRFKAKVGDEDFSCDREYAGLGSSHLKATPQDFRFFVQDLALLRADGSEVPVELDERAPTQNHAVALVDLTEETGSCASTVKAARSSEVVGSVPEGRYDGVAFTNGVPEALNHADTTAETTKDPLRDISLNWNWVSGYRFVIAEVLRTEEAEVDAGAFVEPVTLIHIGSSQCSGSPKAGISCMHSNRNRVRLQGFDPAERSIIADFGAVFAGIDLGSGAQCHGTGAECKPLYTAWGVDMATGQALPAQTVFRAE